MSVLFVEDPKLRRSKSYTNILQREKINATLTHTPTDISTRRMLIFPVAVSLIFSWVINENILFKYM